MGVPPKLYEGPDSSILASSSDESGLEPAAAAADDVSKTPVPAEKIMDANYDVMFDALALFDGGNEANVSDFWNNKGIAELYENLHKIKRSDSNEACHNHHNFGDSDDSDSYVVDDVDSAPHNADDLEPVAEDDQHEDGQHELEDAKKNHGLFAEGDRNAKGGY